MKINGVNYLLLEKRGCNFSEDDSVARASDVGNYRVCTIDEDIHANDGNTYFLEFGLWKNRTCQRYFNKRTGKPLKHPVDVIINPIALHMDSQFTDTDGLSYRNLPLEQNVHSENKSYTTSDILAVVNEISVEQYQEIKWVWSFEVLRPHAQNWTPADLIYKWAKDNRLETINRFDNMIVRMYTGEFKYLCYQIIRTEDDIDTIRVVMEEIK